MEDATPVGNRHRACDPCRRRKVKCSQQTPLCQRCENLNLTCKYSIIQTMGRPRKRGRGQAGRRGVSTDRATEASMTGMLTMAAPPGDFDLGVPDFGPLLPFDSTLHSMPSWPGLTETTPPPATKPWFGEVTASQDLQTPAALLSSWPPATRAQEAPATSNKCACVEMVHRHFSLTDDHDHSFIKTLPQLQSSTSFASQILNCSACFDPSNSLYGLSKNTHLLGSLMSSIASTYAGFLTYQRKLAMTASEEDETLVLLIGPEQGVEFRLSGEAYWSVLKTAVGSEINYLLSLCASFTERQMKTHTKGHEACESGKPDHDGVEVEERIMDDKCPSKIDIARSYSCFRTVEQVRAAILQARSIVEGEGWGEVIGQQCL